MSNIFFSNWESLVRILIIAVLAYMTMIVFLHISGKRSLSKMNAFDLIITIALGSALSTVILDKNVPLIEGALVFFLLIFMQYIITWLSVRIAAVKKLITSKPELLFYKGQMLEDIMKKERITREEIYMAAREKGITDLQEIDAIVLETTGDITIIRNIKTAEPEGMKDVKGFNK